MKIIPDVIGAQDLLYVHPDDNARVAARAMVDRKISSILVVDGEGCLVGIVTERDLTRCFAVEGVNPDETTAGDVMTPSPDTLSPNDSARGALELMELRGYRHLPVVDDDNRPVGIVSMRDLYATLVEHTQHVLERTQTFVFGDRHNPDG